MNLGNAQENRLFVINSDKKYFATVDDINPNDKNSSLSYIINAISENSVVLDVGCSYGYLGEWLIKNKNCQVYGIDIDKEAVAYVKERGYYKDVFNLDLDYPEKTKDEFDRFRNLTEIFDFVICADVLEHLKQPTEALEFIVSKLKLGGQVVVSIPNISHMDIILNLLEGKFNYSELGILDNTHLRFFTKRSFVEWIKSANEFFKNNGFKLDIKYLGGTKYTSEFLDNIKNEYSELYNMILNNNQDLEILQNIFALTKVNNFANTYGLEDLITTINYSDAFQIISEEIDSKKKEIEDLNLKMVTLKGKYDKEIKNREQIIENITKEKDAEIENLQFALSNKESYIKDIEDKYNDINNQLAHIYNSHGWKMLLRYYKIRDAILPEGSMRRRFFKFLLRDLPILFKKSLSFIRMFGAKAFIRKAKMKLLLRKTYKYDTIINIPKIIFPYIEEKELTQYDDVDISVIIPTKNAGKEFEYLLKMLKNQKGFNSIEIIIVDSGSTDETLSIAKDYNTKIINILPEDFSHSYARNIGAENASGNYLLFTVQDALPPTDTWLYNLMVVLKNNDISAVSCAEIPREDADLFYRVICWNHYNFLGVIDNDKISKMPKAVNYITLRQNGQLSDIACLISKEKFMNYKYRNGYAEDLDLGIRLIKDGYKIAFLSSTKIIHSHNRPAYYFLKRSYVDNLFLSDIFNDFPIPKINFSDFVSDIIFTYNFINEEIIKEMSKLVLPIKNVKIERMIEDKFKHVFEFRYPVNVNVDDNNYIDDKFKIIIKNLFNEEYKKEDKAYNGFLTSSLFDFLKITFEYINNTYEFIDEDLLKELKACIYKEYSTLCGTHLAYCYLNSSQNEKQKLQKIHEELKEGV